MCLPLSVSWLFVFSLFMCLNFDGYKWTSMNVTHHCFVFRIILLKYKTIYNKQFMLYFNLYLTREMTTHIHTLIHATVDYAFNEIIMEKESWRTKNHIHNPHSELLTYSRMIHQNVGWLFIHIHFAKRNKHIKLSLKCVYENCERRRSTVHKLFHSHGHGDCITRKCF